MREFTLQIAECFQMVSQVFFLVAVTAGYTMQLTWEGFFRDSYLSLDVISTNMDPVAARPHLLSRTTQASAL